MGGDAETDLDAEHGEPGGRPSGGARARVSAGRRRKVAAAPKAAGGRKRAAMPSGARSRREEEEKRCGCCAFWIASRSAQRKRQEKGRLEERARGRAAAPVRPLRRRGGARRKRAAAGSLPIDRDPALGTERQYCAFRFPGSWRDRAATAALFRSSWGAKPLPLGSSGWESRPSRTRPECWVSRSGALVCRPVAGVPRECALSAGAIRRTVLAKPGGVPVPSFPDKIGDVVCAHQEPHRDTR